MSQLEAELEQVRTELDRAHGQIALLEAEAAGLEAKQRVLAEAISKRRFDLQAEEEAAAIAPRAIPDLRLVRTRKDAILQVLQAAGTELHIDDVIAKLREGGRGEDEDWYAVVASTLNYLNKSGAVKNPRRGYYRAS